MTQKYLTLSRHGIYYFQYWIPKSLNNDVYQKKLLRFSLKTSIKREAEKLSYKLISLIYDLEEQFINSPNRFGRSLLKLKNKVRSKSTIRIIPESELSSTAPNHVVDYNIAARSESLSDCLELFIKEKEVNWNDGGKTKDTVRAKVAVFIETIGDIPVSQLSKEDSRTFKQLMLKFPKNKNKLKRYKNKSFKDILGMDVPDDDIASVVTRSGYLKQVSSFLGWLIDNDYTAENSIQTPLRGVFKGGGSPDNEVNAFNDNDLKKLFENDYYYKQQHRTHSQHWIPLIALFTGARLNEICQLHRSDIKKKNGIWYFDINDKTYDKHLKKSYHARQVPIHEELIKLGLIKFIKNIIVIPPFITEVKSRI